MNRFMWQALGNILARMTEQEWARLVEHMRLIVNAYDQGGYKAARKVAQEGLYAEHKEQ